MDKAPSRFPEVDRVASSAQNKEPPGASGLITGFDQRILLLIPFPWHQPKRSGCTKEQIKPVRKGRFEIKWLRVSGEAQVMLWSF